jgi:hypothetical protein
MSLSIASEKTPAHPEAPARPPLRPWARPVAAPFKLLTSLRDNECRYCVQETPDGQMHRALFCARPTVSGPYCPGHARVCRRPNDIDIDGLTIELASASRA